jgi:signal transduction histidine kinase
LALATPEVERTTRLVRDFGAAPMVIASSARVSRVLLNLVGNALEAMSGRPAERNQLVVRTSRAQDGRFSLEVSDTGTGISEHDLPRVFEPFFTTKAAGRGTGLGLAIAQKIVVEMGGEIVVESAVGRGTTFRVLLPAAPHATTPFEVAAVSPEQTQP